MIKTSIDFENAIKYIKTDILNESDLDKEIQLQEKILDSDKANKSFSFIEKELNVLYEKTRIMQDIVAYTKLFIKQNMDSVIIEAKDILNSIENNNKRIREAGYIAYDINIFKENTGSYIDRDGSELKRCSVNNFTITLSGEVVAAATLKQITLTSNYSREITTIENLKNNTPERSLYHLDNVADKGITETILLELTNSVLLNFVNINLSNCALSNVKYIYEDGTVETEDTNTYKSGFTKTKKVKSISFDLNCDNYKLVKVEEGQ